MELANIFATVQQNLTFAEWQSFVVDDHPDFKQLVCRKSPGLLVAFTRLDLLLMTPELNPTDAAGICLCFLFYADPDNVAEMRRFGRLIRHGDFLTFRQECAVLLQNLLFTESQPAINIKVRPKFEKIRFDDSRYDYPAFFVELDYWLPNSFTI